METRFSEIIAYFENIARKHVAIGHTDEEKHFFRLELDEVLTGLNSKINFPALILEGYDFDFTDSRSDNVIKNRSGAFILLDHCRDNHDFDRIHQIWDNLEEIGDDILIKILKDKRDRNIKTIRNFDMNDIQAVLIANEVGQNYGIRYSYKISTHKSNDVNQAKWA
ncbi:MAG: hypothetical protein K8S00_12150 [Bacteroidales bacterium]|nr:hypothetical protein [Bacteroidales bacterium]